MSEEKKHISTVSEVLELVTKDSGSTEIPINSESDLTQPEPDINGKDCLAQDTLMKDKIKDDDDEEKPDVGPSTSMAAPPLSESDYNDPIQPDPDINGKDCLAQDTLMKDKIKDDDNEEKPDVGPSTSTAAPPLSESDYDDPIQPEPDINGKDCLVQDTLMKDKIKDDDDEKKPDVGPSTSMAAPPFLLKRGKSPRKSATVPQLPVLESIPTQHEDEDMDDDDDDYVDDEDYTPATPMKRRRVMPVRVQSAEIPIDSESDYNDPIQPEPDINGKDCLVQDTLMKDKIKDDDDEKKPDVGPSTSMAAPPFLLKRGKSPRKSATVPPLPMLESIPTQHEDEDMDDDDDDYVDDEDYTPATPMKRRRVMPVRVQSAEIPIDSESDYNDPIQPEPDINGKDCLVQDTLMKDKIKDDDDEKKPDVGPSTSMAAPPFLLKRGKSPRKSPRKSATVPPLPMLESIPTQHEDEDMEDDDDDDDDDDYNDDDYDDEDDDDDDDDDYVEDEDYTPATPMKRCRVVPVRVREDGEERWHNREESDQRPDPLRFMPVRQPGPTFDTTASWSPLSLFQLFFSTPVVRTIITNTNANAAKRLKAGLKFVWKRLTVSDFYIFLSIIIFTGLVKVHDRGDYWRKEWPYHFRFPANTMSRDRFECILWSLHMSDPAEDEENDRKRNTAGYDRLFRIKPLYTDIVNACQALFQPYRNIAIDERMVASKARISMKQYMKAKPIKWGYKLFVLADSLTAYTWNFFVYEGKTQMHIPGQGLSYTSVMNLMSFPLLGRGYTLFVDNFYSSPALFEELSRQNTGACGTIRKNLTSFPKTTHNDLPKNAKRGDMRWIRQNKLLFIKWMDTREVSVVSTVHKVFSGQTVKRRVKENGEWKIANVPIPDPILDYNHNMGGVDVSDALIGYYTVHHKTMKWYKTFFYHFMDIAVVNSFILYKELYKKKNPEMKKPLTQKRFREKLAAEMLEFAKASPSSPPSSPTPATTCMPAYYGDDGTQSRRYCKRCHDAGSKRVKTPLYCMKCQVPLCLTSKRNCFLDWHNSH